MGGQRVRGAAAMIAAGAAARASPAQKFLVGLIGEGIQGSRSPALHEHEARHLGLALHYQLIDLARDGRSASDLPRLIDSSNNNATASPSVVMRANCSMRGMIRRRKAILTS